MSSTNETRVSKPDKASPYFSLLNCSSSRKPALEPLRRFVETAVRVWAWLGGAMLAGIAGMTTVSVLGRVLFAKPLLGDFEITELACAMAVFMFLPLAQWHFEHTIVDIFTRGASARFKFFCLKIAESATLLVALLLLWRMTLGAQQLREAGEVTMILGMPRYLAFPVILLSLALLAIVLFVQLLQKDAPHNDEPESAA